MIKRELIDALKDVDDNTEVKAAYEGDIETSEIINIEIGPDGDVVLEYRDEE
ncbi:hypothetical protein [Sulfurimonas sp.]